VNSDDPEMAVFIAEIAIHYRNKFNKDVVIDLVCYRRHGHNEADEPSGTQPLMYSAIKTHPTVCSIYGKRLTREKVLDNAQLKSYQENYRNSIGKKSTTAEKYKKNLNEAPLSEWTMNENYHLVAACDTCIDTTSIRKISQKMNSIPEDFVLQRQVKKIIDDRDKMATGSLGINWGFAENMAYATLLAEGYSVRITGQDVGRGTFAHRHAVLHDQNGKYPPYKSLQNILKKKSRFDIFDSLLSEEAVLAFEYGYASAAPKVLVIWEAQFGDFANGAQVVIDQFITSGEQKWAQLCGLIMLLPHGYEGQGPEHSSSRLERYLQMCAENNIEVCVPTKPAQVFHLIRRQIIRSSRKPLILMTPKSLLRHKLAVSTLPELAEEAFLTIIDDPSAIDKKSIKRIILTCGKVYYDLFAKIQEKNLNYVAIIRIEQLYPFPKEELKHILSTYNAVEEIFWCQEEPINQGAWYFNQQHIQDILRTSGSTLQIQVASRPESAAPASGYMSVHKAEQAALVKYALGIGIR
jgi:2-oxoglutarate dehydrogenase E1 component